MLGFCFDFFQIFFAFFTVFVLDFLPYSFDSPFFFSHLVLRAYGFCLTDQSVFICFGFCFSFGVVEDFCFCFCSCFLLLYFTRHDQKKGAAL